MKQFVPFLLVLAQEKGVTEDQRHRGELCSPLLAGIARVSVFLALIALLAASQPLAKHSGSVVP